MLERQIQIYDFLKEHKFATVDQLASMFFVGAASIRRDLKRLEEQRLIRRTHGGAVYLGGPGSEIPSVVRQTERTDAKARIGKLAVAQVQDNDTIFLDSSTTVQAMLPDLMDKKLTVLTNSIPVCTTLSYSPDITIYLCGGLVRHNEQAATGMAAARFMKEFSVQKLFFSCRALGMNGTLWDFSESEALLRRTLLAQSEQAFFLCDHSKFGAQALHRICGCEQLHCLLTDQSLPEELATVMEGADVRVLAV